MHVETAATVSGALSSRPLMEYSNVPNDLERNEVSKFRGPKLMLVFASSRKMGTDFGHRGPMPSEHFC